MTHHGAAVAHLFVLLYQPVINLMVEDADRYAAAGLIERVIAAMRLELGLYEYVSSDPRALAHAIGVVLLSGLANGLGLIHGWGPVALAVCVGYAFASSWGLWSVTIWIVTRAMRCRNQGRSLLRAVAFANAPSFVLILGMVPVVGPLVRPLVALWLVATTVPVVQAVYAVPRRRAAVIAIAAFVLYLLLGVASGYFVASVLYLLLGFTSGHFPAV